MKRNYWKITTYLLGLIVVGGIITFLVMNIPKVAAPTTVNNNTTKSLTLYYIAINDNGKIGEKIGCEDSVVAIKTADVTTDDVVKSTFIRLLSDHDQLYGTSGLANTLYSSNLTFVSSSKSGDTITVNLSGDFSLGGVCDIPRVQAQLESAAKTAAGVGKAEIFVNSKPLSEVLSLK